MQVLVSALEPEKMLARVFCCQGFLGGCFGGAAPEVDDEFAVDPDGDGGADLVAFLEIGFEGVSYALEIGCAGSADGDSRTVVHEPPDGDGRCWPEAPIVLGAAC